MRKVIALDSFTRSPYIRADFTDFFNTYFFLVLNHQHKKITFNLAPVEFFAGWVCLPYPEMLYAQQQRQQKHTRVG
jgi:hypothetical protein